MNAAVNRFSNIEVYDAFLGSENGKPVDIFVDSTSASAVRERSKSFPVLGIEKSTVATLDNFLKQKPIESLDLLKTDTDGYDQDVLEGAQKTITRFKPFLFTEFSGYSLEKAKGHSNKSLANLLNEFGYIKFLLFNEKGKPPIHINGHKNLLPLLDHNNSANVFAIHRSKIRIS